MEEEWRDIPGYEGYYQVSDWGQVKSLARLIINKIGVLFPVTEKILKQALAGSVRDMRLHVTLCRDGSRFSRSVHSLVLETFVGPRPEGMEACHNDGDSRNNRLDNLRWDTRAGNQHDRIAHGTDARGEKNVRAKITESQVLEIRARAGTKAQHRLAAEYGISLSLVNFVINRKAWRHI